MKAAAIALLGLFTALPVWAEDDQWTAGFGQGVAEAIVTHGPGNQIDVSCNEGGGPFASSEVHVDLAGDAAKGDQITLTFDGDNPQTYAITDGSITSDCHACAAAFTDVLTKLRQKKSVHVLTSDGLAVTFSLAGAADAITDCTPDFER